MKCMLLMVFLVIFLFSPPVCHSFLTVPPPDEIVSHCKAFLKAPDAPIDEFDTPRPEDLVWAYMMCSQPAILAELTAHEKSVLASLAGEAESLKHELPPEQVQQMEHFYGYYNTKWEQGYKTTYTDREIDEFDIKLRMLWQKMVQALSEGEIEKAASCFHEESQASYRQHFKRLPPEERKKMAGELASAIIELEEISGDAALYILVPERDGKSYLFNLRFMRNMDGEWKILSY